MLHDTRGAKRQLILTRPDTGGVVATTEKTTYLATNTVLHVDRTDDPTELGLVPELEQSLWLRRGDMLNVTRDCSPAPVDADGVSWIGCALPEVFDNASVGEKVYFDDGRIGGEIVSVRPDMLQVRIERAAAAGSRLRAAKGINVPDTRLPIPALTEKDIADLTTVVEVADLVEMSFVQDPSDVLRLHDALAGLGGDRLGVVIKIETRRAFETPSAVAARSDAQARNRRDDRAWRPRSRGRLRTACRTAGRDPVVV